MKKIDCFPYFNEKEILETRLSLLWDEVDLFVITEGDHTHAGDPKALTATETINSLGFPMDKIVVEKVTMPNRYQEPNPWVRERLQRDAAAKYIRYGDVAFVSDCDEVWNPNLIEINAIKAAYIPETIHFVAMWNLMGRADLVVCNTMGDMALTKGPFIALYHHIKDHSLSQIRESAARRPINLSINGNFGLKYDCQYMMKDGHFILDNGWHFSWMGGHDRMNIKSVSYAHANDEVKFKQGYVPKAGGHDPLGRQDHLLLDFDTSKLPELIYAPDRPHLKKYFLPER